MSDDNNTELREYQSWQSYHENIFVDWADKAACYRWLHQKSTEKYIFKRNVFTIPVIIMSTLTGTVNFALDRIPEQYQNLASIAIGSINILAGIITTVAQFLKLNELSESHRVAFIAWDKFHRAVRIEMVKCPTDRIDVKYFIRISKDEFDRLMETSPQIDKDMLRKFTRELSRGKNKEDTKRKIIILENLHKPELFNELASLKEIIYITQDIPEMSQEDKRKMQELLEQKERQNVRHASINTFVIKFQTEYKRLPTRDELRHNITNITECEIGEIVN